jgi:hypothetical protein
MKSSRNGHTVEPPIAVELLMTGRLRLPVEPANGRAVMNSRNIFFAALLLATAAAAPVVAGDATPADTSRKIDAQATGSSTDGTNIQAVIGAIGSIEASSSDIRKATQIKNVKVVDVSGLARADDQLGQAISTNRTDIEMLQASLQSNATLNSALEAKRVDVTQVVAAEMNAERTLTVYVK